GDVDRAVGYLDPIREGLDVDGDPWMRWRYALHVLEAGGRAALVRARPDEALAAADRQLEGASHHRVAKIEARARRLRGQALGSMDIRDDAKVALREAARIAESIEHPRIVWQALCQLGEIARRAGRSSAEIDARRHGMIEHAAASLVDADLRREFGAAHRG